MPRRLRQTQRLQQKQRLVNLALEHDGAEETREILHATKGFTDLRRVFDKDDDYLPWIIAARLNHRGTVQEYLDVMALKPETKKSLLDQEDPNGDSALCASARVGSELIVRQLLQAGASATTQALTEAISGEREFSWVSPKAITLSKAGVVGVLLDHGMQATEDLLIEAYKKNYRAVVEVMIQHGANFSQVLVQAIRDKKVIDGILEANPSVVGTVPLGLSLAEWKECLGFYITRCCSKGGPGVVYHQGLPVVHQILACGILGGKIDGLARAASYGQLEIVEAILTYMKERNLQEQMLPLLNRALRNASSGGRLEIFHLLLQHGADIHDEANGKMETALTYAIHGHHNEIACELIARGASPNTYSPNGGTVLIEAARNGHLDLVGIMLKAGADINDKGIGNATALHYASLEGHSKVAKLLLSYGADPFAKTSLGFTALHLTHIVNTWTGGQRTLGRPLCAALLERYAILPDLFWSSSSFVLLAGLGEETSNALLDHIGSYITDQ